MCDDCTRDAAPPFSRRTLLRGAALAGLTLPATASLGCAAAAGSAPAGLRTLPIRPRSEWAAGREPTGPLRRETDGDVRFLLVHHSVSSNDYARDDAPGLIRGFYGAHTAKGWPDVAYNFFIDRFGGMWEGRTGSLDGPVIVDATGGNQGFAQLCCLIGDHQRTPPTDAALSSLTRLLAGLADRYDIDTAPGSTATFTSRGSNRFDAGEAVTTPTISGHRDMSQTECPGDACYALISDVIPTKVNAIRRAGSVAAPAQPPDPAIPPNAAMQSPAQPRPAAAPSTADPAVTPLPGPASTESDASGPLVAGGVVLTTAAIGWGVLTFRRRAATTSKVLPAPPPPTASEQPRIGHWELACAHDRGDARVVPTAGIGFAERSRTAMIGLTVSGPHPHGQLADAVAAARATATAMLTELPADADPAEAATALIEQVLASSTEAALAVVATVILPERCSVAATDVDTAVILTADGAAYRPRLPRSRTTNPGLARATAPSDDTVAVLLVEHRTSRAAATARAGPSDLTELARQAIAWPSLQLGVQNHVAHPAAGALIAAVNRTALARQVKPATAEPGSATGATIQAATTQPGDTQTTVHHRSPERRASERAPHDH